MKIGIIGNGFVGKATKILKSEKVEIMVYDIVPDLCEPRGLTLEKLCNETDIIFICMSINSYIFYIYITPYNNLVFGDTI